MTNTSIESDLGREITAAERIALATGQTTILDIVHGVALEMDAARRATVKVVMPSGISLTYGEVEDEVRRTQVASRNLRPRAGHSWIIGVNASSNMFA